MSGRRPRPSISQITIITNNSNAQKLRNTSGTYNPLPQEHAEDSQAAVGKLLDDLAPQRLLQPLDLAPLVAAGPDEEVLVEDVGHDGDAVGADGAVELSRVASVLGPDQLEDGSKTGKKNLLTFKSTSMLSFL